MGGGNALNIQLSVTSTVRSDWLYGEAGWDERSERLKLCLQSLPKQSLSGQTWACGGNRKYTYISVQSSDG